MSRMMRFIAASMMSLLALSNCARSLGQTPGGKPLCVLGYTVGFFNGVWNTEADALIGMNALKQSVEEATSSSNDTYNNEDVSYQLFYNQTGNPAGGMSWEDVAEVFQQRQNEIDPTGYFSQQHFYAVWEQLTGSGNFTEAMTNSDSHLETFFANETSSFIAAAASTLGALTSAAPTTFDYTTQNAELDAIAAAGRKMMLVAHSQGNLFVNQGYDHIQPVVGSTRVKVVHIAPASPTLRGQYILSSNDFVINALRADGGSVQPNNIAIAPGTTDLTGHTLVGSYLVSDNPGRGNGRLQVEVLETGALSALTAPSGCVVTLSPSSSKVTAGSSITFIASVNPAPMDNVLNIDYVWSITGNAAGSFPGTTRTATTSVPTITYTVPTGSPSQTVDTVSVKVLEAKTAGDQVNVVDLGTGNATVAVTTDIGLLAPWLGTWKCTSSGGYNGNGGYNGHHTFQFVNTATGYQPPLSINTINYDGSGGPALYFYDHNSAYISGSTLANATFFLSGSTLTQNSTYTLITFDGTTQTITSYPVVSTCTQ